MTKIVVGKLAKKASNRKRSSVAEKRIRNTDGRMTTLRTVDAHSPTFGADLLYVFGKNVAKARRENKRITGVTDGDIRKR